MNRACWRFSAFINNQDDIRYQSGSLQSKADSERFFISFFSRERGRPKPSLHYTPLSTE